jgi:uncharacterized repeat protein (TIGR02543 family)
MLIEKGPMEIAYCSSTPYYGIDPQGRANYYTGGDSEANHAVTLVGYDDDYPRENFTRAGSLPEGDGAFIILNSWGSSWPSSTAGGYFYMSYYEKSVEDCTAFALVPKGDVQDEAYYYDEAGYVGYWAKSVASAYNANVFTVPSDGGGRRSVKSAGIVLPQPGMGYEITAYLNPSGAGPQSGVQIDLNGAASGMAVSGAKTYAGFYTVDFPSRFAAAEGDSYSIIVKYTPPSGEALAMPFEMDIAVGNPVIISNDAEIHSGETWYKIGGSAWYDFNAKKSSLGLSSLGNACIKAYADVLGQPADCTETYRVDGQDWITRAALGGTVYASETQMPSPEIPAHYRWSGWYADGMFANRVQFPLTVSGDAVYYGRFTPIRYMVSFSADGGSAVAQQAVPWGGLVTAPPDPVKEGYVFDGWYREQTLETAWNFSSDILESENLVLYAGWKAESSGSSGDSGGSGGAGETPNIAKASVSLPYHAWTYDGKKHRPQVTVTMGGRTLAAGKDYAVSYGGNLYPGRGYVRVNGKGAYIGVKTIYLTVDPPAPKLTKTQSGKRSVKVLWRRASASKNVVTGYQVQYRLSGSSVWKTKTVSRSKSALTLKKLKKGKTCKVRVRSYRKTADGVFYSAWSRTGKAKAK